MASHPFTGNHLCRLLFIEIIHGEDRVPIWELEDMGSASWFESFLSLLYLHLYRGYFDLDALHNIRASNNISPMNLIIFPSKINFLSSFPTIYSIQKIFLGGQVLSQVWNYKDKHASKLSSGIFQPTRRQTCKNTCDTIQLNTLHVVIEIWLIQSFNTYICLICHLILEILPSSVLFH